MKIHKREQIVADARADVAIAISKAFQKHGVTYGEATQILAAELAGLAKYQIREERHSDASKPGGVE